jgi:DGQHR domain-containing protein
MEVSDILGSTGFERRIQSLLTSCHFDSVVANSDLRIMGREVKALALHQSMGGANNFLIIDAFQKGEGSSGISSKLEEFNETKRRIEVETRRRRIRIEACRLGPNEVYDQVQTVQITRQSKLFFILVSADVEYDDADLEYALAHKISLWGPKYFALSKKLADMIGVYAKYTILRELSEVDLRFEDEGKDDYRYTAFKIDLSGGAQGYTYVFPMLPEKLLKLAYVYRRETSRSENFGKGRRLYNTYQRMLIPKKLKDIGENFLGTGNGSFKNNIIIVFEQDPKQDRQKFDSITDSSIGLVNIHLPKVYASIRVLDGQHRLYGYLKAADQSQMRKKSLIVAGIVPVGSEEAETFLSINKKQTAVNTDILWDLYSMTEPGKEHAICSDTVKQLNDRVDCAFYNRVYVPSDTRGKVASDYPLGLGNLAKTLSDLKLIGNPKDQRISKRTFWKTNAEETTTNAVNNILELYRYLEARLGEERSNWYSRFFLSNNGFNVAMRLLSEIIQNAKGGEFNFSVLDSMRLADGLLFFVDNEDESPSSLKTTTSSEGGRGDTAAELIFAIWLHNQDFAVDFLSGRRGIKFFPKLNDLIKEIISDLRKLIDKAFAKEPDWWDRYVPEDVRQYAADHKRTLNQTDLKEERLYFISEGDLLKIIDKRYNEFFSALLRENFRDRNEFMAQIGLWKNTRDIDGHAIPITPKPAELRALYDFHESIHQEK